MKLFIPGLLFIVAFSGVACGDLIAEWDGVAGASIAAVTGANISAGAAMTRGAGITANAGANFNSRGFDSSTLGAAITASEYITFGFTPASGFTADLDNIQVELDRSSTGPTTVFLLSSIGGFTDTAAISSMAVPDPGAVLSFDVTSLTDIASATEFRFYLTGASSGAGTADIEDDLIGGGSGQVGLQINGVAVPEPSSFAFMGLVGLVVGYSQRQSIAGGVMRWFSR